MNDVGGTRRLGGIRPRVWLVSFLGLTAVVAAVFGLRYQERSSFVDRASSGICDYVKRANPPSPFGAVRTCREAGRDIHPFGTVDGSVYLLLQSANGAVALRVDYSGMDLGSHYRAEAFELDAAHAPGSSDERAQIRHDVAARGGVRPAPWIVHYGDG